jgi:hypothetical protein
VSCENKVERKKNKKRKFFQLETVVVTNFPNNSEGGGGRPATFIFHLYSELLPRMQNNENLFEQISQGNNIQWELWESTRFLRVRNKKKCIYICMKRNASNLRISL